MKILRRFGFRDQSQAVKIIIRQLKERQEQQLSLLEKLKENVDPALLTMNLAELAKINHEKIFNTFATQCLKPTVKALHGLADVNIERVFEKHGQCKIPFTVKDHVKV